MENIRIHFWS